MQKNASHNSDMYVREIIDTCLDLIDRNLYVGVFLDAVYVREIFETLHDDNLHWALRVRTGFNDHVHPFLMGEFVQLWKLYFQIWMRVDRAFLITI